MISGKPQFWKTNVYYFKTVVEISGEAVAFPKYNALHSFNTLYERVCFFKVMKILQGKNRKVSCICNLINPSYEQESEFWETG